MNQQEFKALVDNYRENVWREDARITNDAEAIGKTVAFFTSVWDGEILCFTDGSWMYLQAASEMDNSQAWLRLDASVEDSELRSGGLISFEECDRRLVESVARVAAEVEQAERENLLRLWTKYGPPVRGAERVTFELTARGMSNEDQSE